MRWRAVTIPIVLAALAWTQRATDAAEQPRVEALAALVNAYPGFLDRIDGNDLVWKDGTRMPIDDRKGAKSLQALVDDPDIKDMFAMTYPAAQKGIPPEVGFDPGRARYLPLFKKMYGDCLKTDVMANAVSVPWLPRHYGKTVRFSRINGAAAALKQVSEELDRLPDRFMDDLRPTQGTYNCRPIAGTDRLSAHGFGIAIDIAAAHSHYWGRSKPGADGRIPYRNEIPWEIVRIFEKHGFIWGGKWYHYDTMHFEYRPEIIATAK